MSTPRPKSPKDEKYPENADGNQNPYIRFLTSSFHQVNPKVGALLNEAMIKAEIRTSIHPFSEKAALEILDILKEIDSVTSMERFGGQAFDQAFGSRKIDISDLSVRMNNVFQGLNPNNTKDCRTLVEAIATLGKKEPILPNWSDYIRLRYQYNDGINQAAVEEKIHHLLNHDAMSLINKVILTYADIYEIPKTTTDILAQFSELEKSYEAELNKGKAVLEKVENELKENVELQNVEKELDRLEEEKLQAYKKQQALKVSSNTPGNDREKPEELEDKIKKLETDIHNLQDRANQIKKIKFEAESRVQSSQTNYLKIKDHKRFLEKITTDFRKLKNEKNLLENILLVKKINLTLLSQIKIDGQKDDKFKSAITFLTEQSTALVSELEKQEERLASCNARKRLDKIPEEIDKTLKLPTDSETIIMHFINLQNILFNQYKRVLNIPAHTPWDNLLNTRKDDPNNIFSRFVVPNFEMIRTSSEEMLKKSPENNQLVRINEIAKKLEKYYDYLTDLVLSQINQLMIKFNLPGLVEERLKQDYNKITQEKFNADNYFTEKKNEPSAFKLETIIMDKVKELTELAEMYDFQKLKMALVTGYRKSVIPPEIEQLEAAIMSDKLPKEVEKSVVKKSQPRLIAYLKSHLSEIKAAQLELRKSGILLEENDFTTQWKDALEQLEKFKPLKSYESTPKKNIADDKTPTKIKPDLNLFKRLESSLDSFTVFKDLTAIMNSPELIQLRNELYKLAGQLGLGAHVTHNTPTFGPGDSKRSTTTPTSSAGASITSTGNSDLLEPIETRARSSSIVADAKFNTGKKPGFFRNLFGAKTAPTQVDKNPPKPKT